jgi:hypothetical protein
MSFDRRYTQLILDHSPNYLGVAKMGRGVSSRLRARQAKTIIVTSSFFKAIHRPNPVPYSQPSKEVRLFECPSFSNHLVESHKHGPEESGIILLITICAMDTSF